MKKFALLLTASLLIFASCSKAKPVEAKAYLFNKDVAVVDEKEPVKFNGKTAMEAVKDMTIGWNLGNTLDATGGKGTSSETSWGMPITHPDMLTGLAESKIKTLRLPVSWSNHIIDDNYTIDPVWMERVQMIVDWALDEGMYVILNTHHDNFPNPNAIDKVGYYYPNNLNFDKSVKFLENVWAQICLAFNNGYDEHLVFETLNEPRLRGTSHEWWFDKNAPECLEAADCLNKYNQIIVDTIRASGGNNAERFIAVPGLQCSPQSALAEQFVIPTDTKKDKLIVAVHMYSPYKFAMESPGVKVFNKQLQTEIAMTFKSLNTKFVENGYPVLIGEFGAVNKDNLEARIEWGRAFIKYSRRYGMTSCLWDNGQWEAGNDYNEKFGFYDRDMCEWYFPELIEAMVEEAYAAE